MADPDTASREDIAVERVRVAQAYADCRDGKALLARWVTGMAGPAAGEKAGSAGGKP